MKVAVIYNKLEVQDSDVINIFGMPTKERYDPKMVEMVASALESGGHNVRTIEGNMSVIDELQNFMPKVVLGERPGMVFNMAYGIQGQSRYTHVPAMLEMLGIPYVGSSPAGHAVALDKVLSKMVFLQHNLPTPAFWLISNPEEDMADVRYPVIVKPKMEAVSFGLRVAHNEEELRDAVRQIHQEFQQQTLAEEFIPGREFAVALLGNDPSIETLPIVEIDFAGDPDGFQSADDKMHHPKGKICPAHLDSCTVESLQSLSRQAFRSLGLSDFSRVDFRMDSASTPYILEINSMASLNLTGSFVLAAQTSGLDFSNLVNHILEIAAIRYFGESVKLTDEKSPETKRRTEPLHVRVRRYLRGHLPSFTNTLTKMVAVNSFVHNIESVNAVGNLMSRRLQEFGFQKEIHPQADVGDILYFTNHPEEQNDILLLGNLDTPYDYQNFVPFHEEHGKIVGSGVAESKGGLVVILAALQALRHARALPHIRCGVLLTSDDTLGGSFSRRLIETIARKSKYVVGTKFCDQAGGIATSCAGSERYQIEIANFKGPGSTSVSDLINTVCLKAIEWRKLSRPKEGTVVSITSLNAQKHPGQVSDRAVVVITVSFTDEGRIAKLDKQIRAIAEKGANSKIQVQVRAGTRRSPVLATPVNIEFFEKVKSLAKGLEVPVTQVHRTFSSDLCHVPATVPVLGGFGPIGGNRRSPHEFIVRDSLIDRSALLALVIHDART
jgi:D-alanine-D-alanine ligase